jgi:hypothetical protein
VKEAARALAARIRLVDLEELWSMSLDQPWGLARRRILALLFAASKWDALLYILATFRDSDSEVVGFTREFLDRWFARFNQTSPALSGALQYRVRAALQDARARLRSRATFEPLRADSDGGFGSSHMH